MTRGRKRILDDITATFTPGVTVLLGPNGVGKTTFLERLLFLGDDTGGSIELNQQKITTRNLPGYYAQVGYMPQKWTFSAAFTCRQSLEYAAWLKGASGGESRRQAAIALDSVGLADQGDQRIRSLSGGTQQRVGLAEALVHNPDVLLLDEPTVGLDPAQRATFRKLINAQSTERITILSTHLIDDVASMASRVLIFTGHRLAFDGSPGELADTAPTGHTATSAIEAAYLAIVEQTEPAA